MNTTTHLKSDKRYSITREWTGREKPQWVVRFCGEFVSSHAFHSAALMRAVGESSIRRGAQVIEEIPAKTH